MKPKTEIDLKQVEKLAAEGLTQAEISDSLGISERTFYNRKKDNKNFQDAINKGRAVGIAKVTNKLFEKIEEGNLTAIIFYLKCRAGWNEKAIQEKEKPAESVPNVVIINDLQPDKESV